MRIEGARALQALFHAGGVLADATLSNQMPSYVRAAMAGKLTGAQLLLRTAAAHPTAQALPFSLVAALPGSAGQAGYAAANAGLDALADLWRGSGFPVASLQWGPWAGTGMAARHGATTARATALGLAMIAPIPGLAALEAAGVALQSSATIVAAHFLWQSVRHWGRDTREEADVVRPLFAAFATDAPADGPQPALAGHAVQPTPGTALFKEGLRARSAEVVSSALGGLLEAAVAPDQPLMEAGLDSLGATLPASASDGGLPTTSGSSAHGTDARGRVAVCRPGSHLC